MAHADARIQDATPFRLGGWTVEPLLNHLRKGERTVALEPKVMRLLVCLADRRGQVVTRQILLSEVWGGLSVVDGVMGRAVYQLRRRLAECDGCGADVETIRQVGFRLVCAETRIAPAKRWGRIAGHPVLAWSLTGMTAALALSLTVNELTETPLVRFVTVQIAVPTALPVAPTSTKTAPAPVTVSRPTRVSTVSTHGIEVAPEATGSAFLTPREARLALVRAERAEDLAAHREQRRTDRLQQLAERRLHNTSMVAPSAPPAPPAPPAPSAPSPPAPPAPPAPPLPRSAPDVATPMIIS